MNNGDFFIVKKRIHFIIVKNWFHNFFTSHPDEYINSLVLPKKKREDEKERERKGLLIFHHIVS